MKHLNLAIIGAGPSGMMAGIAAAQTGLTDIALFERNAQLGKKLLMTGKGRCNFTNDSSIEEIIQVFGSQGKFLYPALYTFSNQNLRDFFTERGLESKMERGGRIFPISDQANDLVSVLKQQLRDSKVKLFFDHHLVKIVKIAEGFKLVFANKQIVTATNLLITTGGKSYPLTGSTGDGYRFAQQFGHTIISPTQALSALYSDEKFIVDLAGLSLKNAELHFLADDKEFFKIFGEMLFTHKGISGPVVLTASKLVNQQLKVGKKVVVQINLKPALDDAQLQARLDRDLLENYKKEFQTLLKNLLPQSLIPVCLIQTAIDAHQKNQTLSETEIQKLFIWLRTFTVHISGVAPLEKAIVTAGGVNLKEVDPATMQSKITPNLYFAGEVLDLDAPTGGYNLQAAFSTGYLAGKSVVSD